MAHSRDNTITGLSPEHSRDEVKTGDAQPSDDASPDGSVSENSEHLDKRGIVSASNIISVIRPKDIHIAYAA